MDGRTRPKRDGKRSKVTQSDKKQETAEIYDGPWHIKEDERRF